MSVERGGAVGAPGRGRTDTVALHKWLSTTIGEVSASSSGTTPARSLSARYYDGGTIPWVKTLDLGNSDIWHTDERITPIAVQETSLRVNACGSVLVAMYGGFNQIGRTGLLRIPAAVNQAITAISTYKDVVEPHYLLHVLNYHVSYWRSVASSSRKDPNITREDVRRFPLELPTIEEQRAIADALGDVDALLDALDRLIAKKRDLKQATMQQLLTARTRLPGFTGDWRLVRLGKHVEFLKHGTNSRAELTAKGTVKYLHYGDIHGASGVALNPGVTHMPYLPESEARGLDRLQDGDLVFADASEDLEGVGRSVELCGVGAAQVVSGMHTIATRFNTATLADGFKGYLQFIPTFRDHLRRLAAGTKVYATNRAYIADVELALPDVDEQTAIATVLSDMDAEIAALEALRAKTSDLKQAMMQELLTGRTRLV